MNELSKRDKNVTVFVWDKFCIKCRVEPKFYKLKKKCSRNLKTYPGRVRFIALHSNVRLRWKNLLGQTLPFFIGHKRWKKKVLWYWCCGRFHKHLPRVNDSCCKISHLALKHLHGRRYHSQSSEISMLCATIVIYTCKMFLNFLSVHSIVSGLKCHVEWTRATSRHPSLLAAHWQWPGILVIHTEVSRTQQLLVNWQMAELQQYYFYSQ